MKGRLLIDGKILSPVFLTSAEDVYTIYCTNGDEIEILYTLLRGCLYPGEENTIIIEGFIRKAGDPEHLRPVDGEEYMYRRLCFFPESAAMYQMPRGRPERED